MADLTAGAGDSERARLARVALDAALAAPGVVAASAGPLGLHATLAGTERLAGVSVAAVDEGRYAVDLYLTTALVALPTLAGDVRDRVIRAAHRAGLASAVGPVNVTVVDVELPVLGATA